jgi:glycosidase
MYSDFIPNHNGFRNKNTSGFEAQGGYPGFVLSYGGDQFGDYHNPSWAYNDPCGCHVQDGSLFGLIDIAQEKNHQMIRQPITASTPGSATIPAGTIWNKPDPNNARFYTDQGQGGTALNDPNTGGAFTRYNYNLADPLAGDPGQENATGLLMRNMQWMLQVIGVDGFRIDAARHMPSWVFNYFDNAVFRSNLRMNLDGTIQPVYMFSEVADGTAGNVQPYIRRDLPNKLGISTSETTVKGNRDALDFPLFWAMVSNLSSNGTQNNWHSIRGASLDGNDRPGGTQVWHADGSQGVTFVDSHDDHAGQRPALYKVAYAYTLMKPGNAIVYMNAKEFGEGRTFPYDIGGSSYSMSNDALGGYHGDDIAELVELRNTRGRGDFKERWLDDAFNPNGFSNVYVYERSANAIVALNSRNDSVAQTRNGVQTDFAPSTGGNTTILVELTGNADDQAIDPVADPLTQKGAIKKTLKVDGTGKINLTIPAAGGHGKGYLIYGLASPEGTLSLTNVASTMAGATPTQANNGTARLASIDVITANSFTVQLNTTPVSLQDPDSTNPQVMVRDVHADGDLAMIRMDDSLNINGVPGIDNTSLTSAAYGFENFTTTNSPGFVWNGTTNIGTGSGTYAQTIDTTQLSEGRHYITVRAFRHRSSGTGGDGGPATFTDFKRTIYVDRLPPDSAVVSFAPYASAPNNPNDRDLIVRSVDQTADNMQFLLDLPATLTDAQVIAEYSNPSSPYRKAQSDYYDRDKRIAGFGNINYGNHVATVITYEPTGNFSVRRFSGLFTATNNRGAGFGDMNFSNGYVVGEIINNVGSVEDVLYSQNAKFSSAFDVNGDGLGDNRDLFLLGDELIAGGAGQAVLDAYTGLLLERGDVNSSGATDAADMTALYAAFGPATWLMNLHVVGALATPQVVDIDDVKDMVTNIFRTRPGDFNLDGKVDASDYIVWRKHNGQSGNYLQGDATYNGSIGADDYQVWRSNFGFERQPLAPAGGGTALAAAPEPTTAWLLAAALASTLTLKRRNRWRVWFVEP